MFNHIRHPVSFWLLIAYLLITATMIDPKSIWAGLMALMLVIIGAVLRYVAHKEGASDR